MKHLFVPYDIAILLREKGFNDKPFGFYMVSEKTNGKPKLILTLRKKNIDCVRPDTCSAPIYQQVLDWFERQDIYIYAFRMNGRWQWKRDLGLSYDDFSRGNGFNTKYEALNSVIIHTLNQIK